MGGGPRPGSTGRRSDGGQPESGVAGIEQYGRGQRDPASGLYEWYELPDGHSAAQAEGSTLSVLTLCEQWDLVVSDFASEYGIRLHVEDPTWAEFLTLVRGLLSTDSRLWRHFSEGR